ncbi:hypothetical protein AMK23_02470 [Streptomyces sp. CB02130]|uniref:hypothetical protein n=1 Tax=Streptomyces sp. CB02130 TaxID=1703934 RepID=UPI00093B15F4|nr:hypothetical protein [Streptomyces sp. CB02130]OKJ30310.1 hypothetical protein AMK23_02470 [Streptomyces sp. CB02130]
MTATAAARAAVDPRPARGTAGRRAVQVVLFLGGLLALGLLAGGRAEAQERPEPGGLTASVADVVPKEAVREGAVRESTGPEDLARTAVEPPVRRVADKGVDPVADTADQVVDPVADQVVEPVEAPPVEPVADQAAQYRPVQDRPTQHRPAQPETARKATAALSASVAPATEPADSVAPVVGGAGDAVDRIAGEVQPLVASLPGLPPLLSVLPVPGGDPDAPGAPAPSVPGAGRDAEGSTTPGGTGADASAEHAAGQDRSAGAPGLAPAVPDRSGTPDAGHAQLSAPTPALPPTRDRGPFAPCGDLARTVVADAQGPRGGDLHAASVPGSPYAALVRGAGLPATAAPITCRSGEILEFPG